MAKHLKTVACVGVSLLFIAGCGSEELPNRAARRPDGRVDFLEIQNAVKAINPSDVKEIAFVIEGEVPRPVVSQKGPVKSRQEIAAILDAFTKTSYASRRPQVTRQSQSVLIGLKNGWTLWIGMVAHQNRLEVNYGIEVARVMNKYMGSSTYDQAKADSLYIHTYGPTP